MALKDPPPLYFLKSLFTNERRFRIFYSRNRVAWYGFVIFDTDLVNVNSGSGTDDILCDEYGFPYHFKLWGALTVDDLRQYLPKKIDKYLPTLSGAPVEDNDIRDIYPKSHDLLLPEDTEVDVVEDFIVTPRHTYTISFLDDETSRKPIPGKELEPEVYRKLKKKIDKMVKQQQIKAGENVPSGIKIRIKLPKSQ
ncbi:hypothetical protein SISSUDRAFT_1130390 [Sistotremastrum suecicum HHB10207 ss-3]|uniref:Uncharacterized protein n=1 Tax=Sistotremastrum suecicum HHB10207 ss-3 TaxID=1314776 RepID=A0A166BIF5_9AGAM|nr:hypothetical protein SISSUDRAFT_1130390 [Sistotremastrum suecicum HHB10207 ss-3]